MTTATGTPRVSVVMPVRNGGAYLLPAIESVLGQTYRDFELIVVDDGSTDATAELLAAVTDPRIRIFRGSRRGVVAARNEALGHARGELIACMDADDIAMPRRFARQVEFLDANPHVAVLGSAVMRIDPAGAECGLVTYPVTPEAIRALPPQVHFMAQPAVMMRAAIVREAGGYRALFAVAEDADLWLRIGDSHDLANLAEPLLKYRMHPGQHSIVKRATSRRNVALLAFLTHERRSGRGEAPYLRPTFAASCRAAVEHLAELAPGTHPLNLKMLLALLEGASEDPGSDRGVDMLVENLRGRALRALDARAVWRIQRARREIARIRAGRF